MAKKTIFNPAYKSMIDELKHIRKSCGVNQRELAQMLGVPHCYVGRVETCERRLDIIELITMLRVLKLSDQEIKDFVANIINQTK